MWDGAGKLADVLYRQVILRDLLGKTVPGLIALCGILNLVPPDRTLHHELHEHLHHWWAFIAAGYLVGLGIQVTGEFLGAFWRGPMPRYLLMFPLSGAPESAEQARQLRHVLLNAGRNRELLGPGVLETRNHLAAVKEITGTVAIACLIVLVSAFVHKSEQTDWMIAAGVGWIALWLAHFRYANEQAKFETLSLRLADLITAEQLELMEDCTVGWFYRRSTARR